MFGGIGFMVDGKMCVSVGKGRIMCRIDPATHDTALERRGCTTVVMKGREYRGYVHIDADALSTKGDLDHWVKLALDFNGRAKASTKKKRQVRKKKLRETSDSAPFPPSSLCDRAPHQGMCCE